MEYLSISKTLEILGVSVRHIQCRCCEGRIFNAIKIGSYWAVPKNDEKLCDRHLSNGSYIKVTFIPEGDNDDGCR